MKMKRQSLREALSKALAPYAGSSDGKVTHNTLELQVNADIQMRTVTTLLTVQVAYSADAEIMGLMLLFPQAVDLVVNKYLEEHAIVEFLMYLADPQGQIRSLVPLFLKRNKNRKLSTRPLKESFPRGDQEEILLDLVSRKQFRRLLQFLRPVRGPDTVDRERRTWEEKSVGPAHPDHWTNFDVNRTMKALRTSGDVETLKLCKKLHVRWWHATYAQMKNIFQLADLPSRVMDHCQTVVDTCKVCREWARPLSEAVASIEVTTRFNHQVELDLLFHGKHIILHMVDRCTRWHAAVEIPDKTMASIVTAVQSIWVHLHGSMSELIVDGESAVKSWQADKYFENHTIDPIVRAPGQHARFIERRGALLRESLNRIQSDLRRQGIEGVPFPYILAEAVFCGNALLSVNNTTPYAALYGRVPNILPDINRTGSATPQGILPAGSGSSSSTEGILSGGRAALPDDGSGRRDVAAGLSPVLPGSIRHAEAVREAAVAAMVQQMAYDRINRANKTKTLPAAQSTFKEGMTVEFFRPASQKDLSGWTGPAVITNCDEIPRGIITIKHKSGEMKVSPGDLRPYLEFFVFHMAAHVGNVTTNALTAIQQAAHHLQDKAVLNLGFLPSSKGILPERAWQMTKSTETHQRVWAATQEFSDALSQPPLTSSRIGRGLNRVRSSDTSTSLVVSWDSKELDELTYHWLEPNSVLNFKLSGLDSPSRYWLQLTYAEGADAVCPVEGILPDDKKTKPAQLSTIDEVSDEESDDDEYLFTSMLDEWHLEDSEICPSCDPPFYLARVDPMVDPVYHLKAANLRAGLSVNAFLTLEREEAELEYSGYGMTLVSPEAPLLRERGQCLVFKVNNSNKKKMVIERDTDLLTPEEVLKHDKEVMAAIMDELKTWLKFRCFSRKSRKQARNIVDCKWVIKWKKEVLPDGNTRRIIRARLTIRGFKDRDKDFLESYAGTSQRYSQRLLISEAATRRWPIAATDISKAFLQGVTYEELAALTGEPLREVNFYLPTRSVAALKLIPGFESFDPNLEVLHCDKPGTGSVDAPRAFHLKLATILRGELNFTPCKSDEELLVLHSAAFGTTKYTKGKPTLASRILPTDRTGKDASNHKGILPGDLVAIVAIHVDDLKFAGPRDVINWIITCLESYVWEAYYAVA